MSLFRRGQMLTSSVWNLYRMQDRIDLNPVYQREGDVWTRENRQLLIDTLLNGFDVPKMYLHKLATPIMQGDRRVEYTVIDGKQRLSSLWAFIRGDFGLAEDFSYLNDNAVDIGGFSYADIAREYPDIKSDFDSYNLQIIEIETDDLELVEDMFSRLNEAVPLNAAEKRNARPGPLPDAVRNLVKRPFFASKLPFDNRRYRHFDLAAKMLFLVSRNHVVDTKKVYIDNFFEEHASSTTHDVSLFIDKANVVLSILEQAFQNRDPLLRSVGMIILYFLAAERALEKSIANLIVRPTLIEFERVRIQNRTVAETDIAAAGYRLLEFDRYTQSPNDAVALRFRLAVIDSYAFDGALGYASLEQNLLQ